MELPWKLGLLSMLKLPDTPSDEGRQGGEIKQIFKTLNMKKYPGIDGITIKIDQRVYVLCPKQ